MSSRRGLVAFGGNALIQANEKGTIHEQKANARAASRALIPLFETYDNIMVVHGNGPQVGQNLIRVEEAVTKVPPLPLDVCVAETQGSMGYIIEKSLGNELYRRKIRRDIISVLSLVEVDAEDPAFKNPTKPIGPFYTAYRAKHLMEEERWPMVEDSGRGYRKVVPSPKPRRVLYTNALKALYDSGIIVIAGLACELEVDELIFLTSVPCLYINFGKPDQKALHEVMLEDVLKYQKEGQFPPGSMGPKVEAAAQFLARRGGSVLLTDAEHLSDALKGGAGTRIFHKKSSRQRSSECSAKTLSQSTI
ncbi:MAG: carbamate kinase [Acidobacteriota bacterium]